MGHDHHHAPYVVPKAAIYKVENAPELVKLQEALERRGLKDPWIRNEVWRYDVKQFSTHRARITRFMLRGLPVGAALFAATIGAEYVFSSKDSHGHDHGHGDH